jgi:hypothetical protein
MLCLLLVCVWFWGLLPVRPMLWSLRHEDVIIIIIDIDGDYIITVDMLCLISKAKQVHRTKGREMMFLAIPAGTKASEVHKCGQLCVKICEDTESHTRTLQLQAEPILNEMSTAIKVEIDQTCRAAGSLVLPSCDCRVAGSLVLLCSKYACGRGHDGNVEGVQRA